ncbi:MAG: glycosyltransferase family 10 domain-containing protein [Bacteroidota bacterium]
MITIGVDGLLLKKVDTFLAAHANKISETDYQLNNCRFQYGYSDEVDLMGIFNTPSQELILPSHVPVVAFMMEPGHSIYHPWMYQQLDQYDWVLSPMMEANLAHAQKSHGFLGWHLQKPLKEIQSLKPNQLNKPEPLSIVITDKTDYPGHVDRLRWLAAVLNELQSYPLFGQGFNPTETKWEMHAPFKYSVVLENSCQPDYITEKILDAFLCYTVPIYRGCTNIQDYFPPDSLIDVTQLTPTRARERIKKVLSDPKDYQRRLPALKKAHDIVVNEFNPLAKLTALAHQHIGLHRKRNNIQPIEPPSWLTTPYRIWNTYWNRVRVSRQLRYLHRYGT